jgi:hypothetical protein
MYCVWTTQSCWLSQPNNLQASLGFRGLIIIMNIRPIWCHIIPAGRKEGRKETGETILVHYYRMFLNIYNCKPVCTIIRLSKSSACNLQISTQTYSESDLSFRGKNTDSREKRKMTGRAGQLPHMHRIRGASTTVRNVLKLKKTSMFHLRLINHIGLHLF